MTKEKLRLLLGQLLRSPMRFPVEAAMGVAFFIIAFIDTETREWNEVTGDYESAVNGDILSLFVPLMALSFWLGRVNRWAYYASFFLFVPLMALHLKPFLWTYGFGFTYALAAILLIVGYGRLGNRPFTAHVLHVVTQLFFGLLIAGLLFGAVMVILLSFFYIFSIETPENFFTHVAHFVWLVVAPQICCTLVRQNEDEVGEPMKVLQLILNFILSPAVIIYTVILYTYFVKIAFEWELPKGGVAWMVMGFVTAALAGRMAQYILPRRYFDWFYRHFTWIAIPPLIMYWIGSVYRIRLYSFTESRFYLMVAGVLMTLFVLMLIRERTRKFQLMALIFAAAIVLFTYIPGISAKSIGLRCQQQRLDSIISELKLADGKTGKLNDSVDMRAIKRDSLLCERYQEACSIIQYVRTGMGNEAFKSSFGEWEHSGYEFRYDGGKVKDGDWVTRPDAPLDLGDYRIMLPDEKYVLDFDGQMVTVRKRAGAPVLDYPINALIRRDTMLLHQPQRLMTHGNDSLLLVLWRVCLNDSVVTDVGTYNFMLFRKR